MVKIKSVLIWSCFTLMVFVSQASAGAAVKSQDNVFGQSFTIDSKALSEPRDIQIYLPQGYESSDKRYPVLYIVDGQRLFLHGVSLQQTFTSANFELSPDFIVVGINNSYPKRFGYLMHPAFREFVAQELVPHIDKHYRTSNERLLYGWEVGGGFVMQTLINKPELFDAYIAASPFPLNRKGADGKTNIDLLAAKLDENFESFLYFAVSENEQGVVEGTDELAAMLKQHNPAKLDWHYRKIDGEDHESMGHATLYQALRSYFKYYPELFINTLVEFDALGGMDYVHHYNKTRAKQYGFEDKLLPFTMYALVRAAIRSDNYKRFEWFVDAFAQYQLADKIKFYRTFEIADYYLKYQKADKALAWYQKLLKREPDSAKLHNALGAFYLAQKDKTNAAKYYQQAVKLATEQKDKKLTEYQADLDKL